MPGVTTHETSIRSRASSAAPLDGVPSASDLLLLDLHRVKFMARQLLNAMPKVVGSVGLVAIGGTRMWGVPTPTGADFPVCGKKSLSLCF